MSESAYFAGWVIVWVAIAIWLRRLRPTMPVIAVWAGWIVPPILLLLFFSSPKARHHA
jgi:hypothetical protein